MSWPFQVYSLELRKLLSYRVDFWVQFFGSVFVHFAVAYFLWKSIFAYNHLTELGGYTFNALMFYYLLTPFVEKATHGQFESGISREIYDGSLNKYLLYPINVFLYKFVTQLSHASIALIQLSGTMVLVSLWFHTQEVSIQLSNIFAFILFILIAGYLIFSITICIELVAFWADNVWSLLVMLRLTTSLLGGALIPLEMFPESIRTVLIAMPFHIAAGLPVKCLMGRLSTEDILYGYVYGVFWSLIFTFLASYLFKRGLKTYSGVGI